jgi:hypothetical protein
MTHDNQKEIDEQCDQLIMVGRMRKEAGINQRGPREAVLPKNLKSYFDFLHPELKSVVFTRVEPFPTAPNSSSPKLLLQGSYNAILFASLDKFLELSRY